MIKKGEKSPHNVPIIYGMGGGFQGESRIVCSFYLAVSGCKSVSNVYVHICIFSNNYRKFLFGLIQLVKINYGHQTCLL